MVVRGGELVFMSPQQQHEFNFPYQIGSPDSMADTPHAAQVRHLAAPQRQRPPLQYPPATGQAHARAARAARCLPLRDG